MTINATRAALSGDRELLEMAAKAIGGEYLDGIGLMIGGSVAEWNPMADDGDALRLAVKLSLIINNQHNEVLVEDRRQDRFWQPHDGDEQAATRRAIVRAAASIARAALAQEGS